LTGRTYSTAESAVEAKGAAKTPTKAERRVKAMTFMARIGVRFLMDDG
jgi:hypothetical protein